MTLNLNLKDFLKYLLRFKWLLLSLPILFAVVTYLLAKKLPKDYKSSALVSTGITNQFQQTALSNGQQMDFFKLSQQFGNLLEMMKSKRNVNTLSYKLVLHDLKMPSEAFKEMPGSVEELSQEDRARMITEYEYRLNHGLLISVADNGERIKLFDVLKEYGYDEQSILKNLEVYRNGESDFIKIDFLSNNPYLSAFVVNTFATDFIAYYTHLSVAGQAESLALLDSIMKRSESELQQKEAAAQSAAIGAASQTASAANAQRRAEQNYSRYAEAQGQRQQYIRQISSIKGTLADIDAKLRGEGGYLKQEQSKQNASIIAIESQLKIANQKYINNNFNPQDKKTVDSLQRIKDRLINSATGTANLNPATVRQDLLNQRLKLEGDLAAAESALNTVEKQLAELPAGSIGGGVALPAEGAAQNIARDAQSASTEYEAIRNQYTQAQLAAKTGSRLALAEPGLPGPAEKSKNIVYVGLSGMSTFIVCVTILFLLFALNKRVYSVHRLAVLTRQKVLGCLNLIESEDKDLRNIWKDNGNSAEFTIYKDLLRSLRFEINKQLSEQHNVLGITSLVDGAGKTFLAGSLSYAFAMMGKNVLLICEKDGNILDLVTNNKASDRPPLQKFESFLVKKHIQIEDRITILNRNTTKNNSLLELRDMNSLVAGFEVLKDTFDIIIIDIDSGTDIHNVKEWMMFCDSCLSVFEAGTEFSEEYKDMVDFLSAQPGFSGWVLNKVKTGDIQSAVEKN
ncbi:hypothetical protein GCM10027051_28180 [Niabella terrae]